MEDLRAQAWTFLKGPCCVSKDEPNPPASYLISRYARGEPASPVLRDQLSKCLAYAQAHSTPPTGATGPALDASYYYERAAAFLERIQTEWWKV